jgi:hypothetical protein
MPNLNILEYLSYAIMGKKIPSPVDRRRQVIMFILVAVSVVSDPSD